jgi:hypothetical protein
MSGLIGQETEDTGRSLAFMLCTGSTWRGVPREIVATTPHIHASSGMAGWSLLLLTPRRIASG